VYAGQTAAPSNAGAYPVAGAVVDSNYEGRGTGLLVIAKAPQGIAFPAIPDQTVTSRVRLAAAASSGLPVSFAVLAGPAQLQGNLLAFAGPGAVRVQASQAGDANWLTAPPVTHTFAVSARRVLGIAQADFDGDGLSDPSVYFPDTGVWRLRLSGAGYAPVEFADLPGTGGFLPAAADYDGDGRADPAVYAEGPSPGGPDSGGHWHGWLSGHGYASAQRSGYLGGPGWAPAPADFDGDGRADPAVFHPASGDWRFLLSRSGYAPLLLPQFLGRP